MPEMPEVETIARKLRKNIVGKSIESVWLSGLPLRRPVEERLAQDLTGRSIRRIHRKGKYLIAELEPRAYWLIHLGMSGRLFFFPSVSETQKHTHARIRFTDSSELQYRDHRRFGLLAFYPVERMTLVPELQQLGRDPLSPGLTVKWLGSLLSHCSQEIKSFLLDQRKIAGLGNIYVCEALFRAHIDPRRRCHTITESETKALIQAVQRTLRLAVLRRGTSFSDFLDSDGELGENQRFLRVFQLEGKRCRKCHTMIERLRQGNRSTFFCPRCQR